VEVDDSNALLFEVFWPHGGLQVTRQRIRDMVKTMHHLQPGFALLTKVQRQSELQRLLSLPAVA